MLNLFASSGLVWACFKLVIIFGVQIIFKAGAIRRIEIEIVGKAGRLIK